MPSWKNILVEQFIKKGLYFGGAFIGATHLMADTPYTSKQAALLVLTFGLVAAIISTLRGGEINVETQPSSEPKTMMMPVVQRGILMGLFFMGANHLLDGSVYTAGHAAIVLLAFSVSSVVGTKWHAGRLHKAGR